MDKSSKLEASDVSGNESILSGEANYESDVDSNNSIEDSDNEEEENDIDYESNKDGLREPKKRRIYLPNQPIGDGEELTYDSSAYIMYHQADAGAPCLSFDVIQDDLGENRETFPLSCYIVGGTESHRNNSIVVLKMSNLTKMKYKNEDDENSSSSSSEEDVIMGKEPILKSTYIKHEGTVNRIKSCKIQNATIGASWSSEGSVHIWNLSEALKNLDNKNHTSSKPKEKSQKPIYSFPGHQCEGFAIAWNNLAPGKLAPCDCNKNIHIWSLADTSGSWAVDQVPLSGHKASVEDIVWSPSETNIMASCSVDQSIRIWDIRCAPSKASKICIEKAHDSDVNVIDWNKIDGKFLLSGGDDGIVKVWDLSMYRKDTPLTSSSAVAKLKHHTAPITSVEWHPTDSSVFATAGEDDQLVIWDIAVEKDDDVEDIEGDSEDLAILPQILFIHQGQKEIKELHWHKQLTGVIISTALTGFDIFRTIST